MNYKYSRNVYMAGKPTISTEELAFIFRIHEETATMVVRNLIDDQVLGITPSTHLALPYMYLRKRVDFNYVDGELTKVESEDEHYGYFLCINASLIVADKIERTYNKHLDRENYFDNLILKEFHIGKRDLISWWNETMINHDRRWECRTSNECSMRNHTWY